MTRVLLVRHATCAAVGHTLAGRAPGHALDAAGRAQAAALASALATCGAAAVYASPLDRTMETARALGAALGVDVVAVPALVELDVGAWTGASIAALDADGDDAWRRFNAYRSGTRAPGGELQLEAQARATSAVLRLADDHPDATIVVVSHADVIKSIVGHVLGIPIDLQHRLDIAPASVSTIELSPWGARVQSLNWSPTPA